MFIDCFALLTGTFCVFTPIVLLKVEGKIWKSPDSSSGEEQDDTPGLSVL